MQLHPYQITIAKQAVLLLTEFNIACLTMEMRTGKTATALKAADLYGVSSVLFVTKKLAIGSVAIDWQNLKLKYELDLTNFEQLHNCSAAYDLIIVDECHSIGAFPKPSERTKELKRICEGKPIIYLSGTITPESYSQLYHILYISSFSPFTAYRNFYRWAADYVIVKKKYFFNREINDYSHAIKEKIDAATGHLFISYTQQESGFTQAVEEEILYVKMQPGTYWLANKLKKDKIHIGRGGEEILADTSVKLMNKLHQVYSGTVLSEDGNAIVFDYSKAKFIRDHFKGRKIAIFYKFIAERAMLIATFGYDTLTGDPQAFNERDDLIFISQVQSGREGISLATADCLVMLNIDFSNVSYWQSRARLQHKDRTKEAKVFWIFSEAGIEDKIYKAVSEKRNYVLSYFKKDFMLASYDKKVGAIIIE